MNPVRPFVTAALLGLFPAGAAHALSCEEIVAMVDVSVPIHIIVQTIDDSGGLYDAEDIACLEHAEVPEPVLAAARALLPQEGATNIDPGPPVLESSLEPVRLGEGRTGRRGEPQQDGRTPEDIEHAIKLVRANKPLGASLMLADLLEEDRHPDRQAQLHYYLARALQDLELTHAAQHHYLEALKRGPSNPWFDHALVRLVRIAEQTGDNSDLARVVAKLAPDHWPRRVQPILAYLQGVRYLEQDELSRARQALGHVPTHSPHGLQARYLEGIIHNKQGRYKSAVRAFQEVITTEVEAGSRDEAVRQRDLKNLALVDVARIHYGLEIFDRAEELYAEVEPESRYWPTARMEMAWAQFMQNDTSGSLGQILTVRSPYYEREPFLPEADVLRALNHFTLCEYDEVDRLMVDFEARVRPQHEELRAFARRYASTEGRQLADEAWATYFEAWPSDSALGREIFSHMLRNRDLAAQALRLESLEHELELIGAQKARWTDSMEPRLRPVLEAERQRTRRRAGLLLLAESAHLTAQLGDLLAQAEIIRFEATDATRIVAQDMVHRGVEIAYVIEVEGNYATNPDEIYWPFNGEFWADELGSYVYAGESLCR